MAGRVVSYQSAQWNDPIWPQHRTILDLDVTNRLKIFPQILHSPLLDLCFTPATNLFILFCFVLFVVDVVQQFRQVASKMVRRTNVLRQQVRNMGHDEAQAAKDMELMKKATMGGTAVVGVLCVVNVGIHMSHEHGHELPAYPYLQIYNKPFPWRESKCNLFDLDCKAKARALK